MAEFTWRGVPIKDAQGNTAAVQPMRAIQANDGLWYSGILGHDAEGNAFTYNQVPNDYSPVPLDVLCFLNTLPRLPDTEYRILEDCTIVADYIIMA